MTTDPISYTPCIIKHCITRRDVCYYRFITLAPVPRRSPQGDLTQADRLAANLWNYHTTQRIK
ncbi:hypothetical protein HOLleu_31277 [Holothuria leucospilota]|uniref:Uncharacterized protein n=1 Tax=Holothuria leucospilota TaxID=206669 RepID=A0A9Q0YRP1_HOLLE|nr:hypothetical protein HOLleu_31277 [Holothuria leucospilota]